MYKLIFSAAMLIAFCLSGAAQDGGCTHQGWIEDKDPKGTNIRNAPGLNGKVIGNVPFAKDDGEQAIVEIVGYSGGWLKIKSAESVDGVSFFTGTGWISAKKVRVNIETGNGKPATLYSSPKKTSRKLGSVPTETLITINGFDCFGLRVTYKGKTGWIAADDACGNPVTTCP